VGTFLGDFTCAVAGISVWMMVGAVSFVVNCGITVVVGERVPVVRSIVGVAVSEDLRMMDIDPYLPASR
jgi:hypothetical protein